jgi:hypothetical protein
MLLAASSGSDLPAARYACCSRKRELGTEAYGAATWSEISFAHSFMRDVMVSGETVANLYSGMLTLMQAIACPSAARIGTP